MAALSLSTRHLAFLERWRARLAGVTISRLLFAALVLVTGCWSASRSAATNTSTAVTPAGTSNISAVHDAIRSQTSRYLRGVERGDTSAITAVFAEDGQFLAPNGSGARGRDAVIRQFRSMFGVATIQVRHHPIDIALADDYAIETGAYGLVMQPKNGAAVADTGKYVVVWQKQADGVYRIYRDIFNSDLPTK